MTGRTQGHSENLSYSGLSAEQQQYIGQMASGPDAKIANEQDGQPKIVLNLADFHQIARERMRPKANGTGAYRNLIRIAQDQEKSPGSFCAQLPRIEFGIMPADANQREDWASIPDEFGNLTFASLRAFVDNLDELLGGTRTHKAENIIYDGLGKLIGPAQVEFWREAVYFSSFTERWLEQS